MRFLKQHKRLSWALALILGSLLIAEEARFGYVLGGATFPCEFFGGKHAFMFGRCITRACYWFDDCGAWAAPSRWRDRIVPGDSIATVVFWLGRPSGFVGDAYYWPYGKGGSGRHFAAIFRDGRFVEWHDDDSMRVTNGE